jgi:hypothetical protein
VLLARRRKSGGRIPPLNQIPHMRKKGEGKVIPPPLSPSHTTPLPFGDITNRQVGIAIGGRRPKQTQTGTRLLDGMLQQPHLVPVTPDSKGFSVLLVLTELTHLSRISQVMLGFRAVTAWVSSSSPRGGVWNPCPRRPALEPSWGCHPHLRVEPPTLCVDFCPSYLCI